MERTVLLGIMRDRFKEWEYPKVEEGKLTKYNWMVQNKDGLKLGYKTDIGAFTYINAKNGVVIEDYVQINCVAEAHCIFPGPAFIAITSTSFSLLDEINLPANLVS